MESHTVSNQIKQLKWRHKLVSFWKVGSQTGKKVKIHISISLSI